MSILPGSTLGIFGGGQLGRMLALAARPMGYKVCVLDPDPNCATKPVADYTITAPFTDVAAAKELAKLSDVITLEIEKVATDSVRAASESTPVRPNADVLHIIQDRGRQKAWLQSQGFPVTPYREVASAEGLAQAAKELGPNGFVKVCHGGYDGRGQARLAGPSDAQQVFETLGKQRMVLEAPVPLDYEISVMVARSPSDETRAFPPAFNHHEKQILVWSVLPAPIPSQLATRAQALAEQIARAIGSVGLLCVEMFVTRDGDVLVNELAPRPHNSYHASDVANVTSQFEQGVRAVCNLPLGNVDIVRPAAIYNLLGDVWQANQPPNFAAALRMPGVKLNLYGKNDPRPGRKMGHLTATGETPEDAVERVKQAYAKLSQPQ